MDLEILKRVLHEFMGREPFFLGDLFLDALRSDGLAADVLLGLFTKHPDTELKLAQAVAGSFVAPLNVATKAEESWPRM